MMNRLITFNDYVSMSPKFRECETMMQYKIDGASDACEKLTTHITNNNARGWAFNPYDITQPCPNGGLCYNFTFIENFMNMKNIKNDLGVPADMECYMF